MLYSIRFGLFWLCRSIILPNVSENTKLMLYQEPHQQWQYFSNQQLNSFKIFTGELLWVTYLFNRVVEISLLYFVLLYYSHKFWTIIKTRVSFEIMQFDQVLTDIFEVKDTRYHSFIFLRFSLMEMKVTDIWTFLSKNCSVHHKRHHYQQE